MRFLVAASVLCLRTAAICAPPREPAPTIEPTGPVRVARYVKPFAQPQPDRANRDFAARYTYGTPFYWGCCGSYGYGGYFYLSVYYLYRGYFSCYFFNRNFKDASRLSLLSFRHGEAAQDRQTDTVIREL